MPRNLDLTALRSFVAVADSGGVTRAAGYLNLTQSAVSMQIKRLEESLDVELLERSGRGVALTSNGEQLVSYARRMLNLNDEAIDRLTAHDFGGEITLGVPHDIVYPHVPEILRRFNAAFPRVRVNLVSSYSRALLDQFARGQFTMILTTEQSHPEAAEVLSEKPLVWIGAKGGSCWRQRPLRFGSGRQCMFRAAGIRAMEKCGITWELAVESESDRTIEATVRADLAIALMLEGTEPPFLERIDHNGNLPDLPSYSINLYVSELARGRAEDALLELVRAAYRSDELTASSPRPSQSNAAA
ncbi:LysR family transcriptional regulator [Aliiruegeria sabulilitoris]|uniref:LysR family transcriptional regulator n=1 Tax=Aliiruegeria sabulilitoris TaxID=1510458 RepID=UPI000834D2E1|nr:LysR family transcriptional regulator [Aliiruegeria sabulilitoris]NDR57972.1 LysR family transcriptional regulator [Pseudoruegeria sp. M32A2M]